MDSPTLNLPNALTVFRVMLVPVIVVLLGSHPTSGDYLLATALYALAVITDLGDGHLARTSRHITTFGKLMDPLADKLLVGATLITLATLGRVAVWVVIVIIVREVAVTVLRLIALKRNIVIAADRWGKVKASFQNALICVLMIVGTGPTWVGVLLLVTMAVTLLSGMSYFFNNSGAIAATQRS